MIEPRNRRGEAETCRWSLCGSSDGDEWVELHKGTWCLAQDALCVSPVSGVCSAHRCPPARPSSNTSAYGRAAARPLTASSTTIRSMIRSMQVLPVQNRRRQVGRRLRVVGAPPVHAPRVLRDLVLQRGPAVQALASPPRPGHALRRRRQQQRRPRRRRVGAGRARGGAVRGGGAGCPRPRRGDCVRAWAAAAGRGARRDELI